MNRRAVALKLHHHQHHLPFFSYRLVSNQAILNEEDSPYFWLCSEERENETPETTPLARFYEEEVVIMPGGEVSINGVGTGFSLYKLMKGVGVRFAKTISDFHDYNFQLKILIFVSFFSKAMSFFHQNQLWFRYLRVLLRAFYSLSEKKIVLQQQICIFLKRCVWKALRNRRD